MKSAVQCLCFLHFALLSFGLDTYISLSRSKASHSHAGYINQDRVRTLFTRRALYEQQKNHETKKSRVVPHPPPQNDTSRPRLGLPKPPVKPKPPVMPRCSLLGQSCVPLSGCCDPCATCHCRFFNAICFCRRAERARSRCGSKKTAKRRKARKKSKTQP
ncbi:agouti-signaling protein-like isoform X1 [Xiphophorus maculatus]|uniref:Agouti-signaling protein-like n=1 Tax=Xiphophorus maculatus TaxID=8083 RepID=M3ZQ55_XIPMA|nr:agouti-signaling protein-like isoform X1 [Xiphophorus maculatus]